MAKLNQSAQQKHKEFIIHKAELNTKITTFFNKMTSPWAETIYLFYENQGFSEAEIAHFSIKRTEYIDNNWVSGNKPPDSDVSSDKTEKSKKTSTKNSDISDGSKVLIVGRSTMEGKATLRIALKSALRPGAKCSRTPTLWIFR